MRRENPHLPRYVSPFKLPACQDPEEAREYPFTHRTTGCPVHGGNREHRDWRRWFEYREEYAASGNNQALAAMLAYVTAETPPGKRGKKRRAA